MKAGISEIRARHGFDGTMEVDAHAEVGRPRKKPNTINANDNVVRVDFGRKAEVAKAA